MQSQITLKLSPAEAADAAIVRNYIARSAGKTDAAITGYHILKQSIDARGRQVWINLTVLAFIDEPFHLRENIRVSFRDVSRSPYSVIIVGAGPAGLFAALRLLEAGIKPVILERGKNVRDRRRDLAALNKAGIVNPESNYCFGEGGAGTYSDGKLYTRSSKRGNINRVLQLFHQFGAEENILYEAHPHIGTNKLPHIITAMRQQVIDAGGVFLFEKKLTDLVISQQEIKGVITADGEILKADAVVLATGHSARDVFELLHRKNILIEAKPFALGVRIEHPQSLIDSIQYHNSMRDPFLPPASYGVVEQVNDRGVFSFCMCPGGIIAPAATHPGELVVNGWSPSKRNNVHANSGMVVQITLEDAQKHFARTKPQLLSSPLLLMYFQQAVEQAAYQAGGGALVAPAQRVVDFCMGNASTDLPDCSYLPGITPANLGAVLPGFVYQSLQAALKAFGNRMRGYYTNDAVVVATESRTSSPVRIPRHNQSLEHPQIKKLYPCGEGAGYAGGIVSAAMDGERVAEQLILKLQA